MRSYEKARCIVFQANVVGHQNSSVRLYFLHGRGINFATYFLRSAVRSIFSDWFSKYRAPPIRRWRMRGAVVATAGAVACRGLVLTGDKPTIDADSASIVATNTTPTTRGQCSVLRTFLLIIFVTGGDVINQPGDTAGGGSNGCAFLATCYGPNPGTCAGTAAYD
jgi:hypothetical protein